MLRVYPNRQKLFIVVSIDIACGTRWCIAQASKHGNGYCKLAVLPPNKQAGDLLQEDQSLPSLGAPRVAIWSSLHLQLVAPACPPHTQVCSPSQVPSILL